MAIRTILKDGKKLYEVYVNGSDARGRRIQRKRSSIESLRKAEVIEFEMKRDLAFLKEQKVDLRWEEWVCHCLRMMKVQYQPSTLYSYETTLNKWVNGHFKGKELRQLTKADIHSFIFEGLPPDTTMFTRHYVLKIIKRVLQMAIDAGEMDRNITAGLRVKVPESEKKVLTAKEVEVFLNQAKITNHRFYPIWIMALFTGMRSGELYALRWTDVDLDNAKISVSKSWSSKNGVTSTKNQKSRVVPISDELMEYLRELKLQSGDQDHVLPHPAEWTRGGAAKVTKEFCKSIGITEIKFHDLRATFITNLLSQGTSIARVMSIVGHSDMDTTNVYLRMAAVDLTGATDCLDFMVPTFDDDNVLPLRKELK